MQIVIDTETLPDADKAIYLEEARLNFKAPSTLTKEQAAKDLGVECDKFTNKDSMIAKWVEAFKESKSTEYADELWRKTALDGGKGSICAIAIKPVGGEVLSVSGDSESELLENLITAIESVKLSNTSPFFIGHRVVFDLKFLFRRYVINGIKPDFSLPFHGYHNRDYFCTAQAWCERNEYISLDNLSKCLGIEGKVGMTGKDVCDVWNSGEHEKVREYNRHDVDLTEQVFRKLTFL